MLFSGFRKTCYSKCCKISYNIWSIINFDIRVTFDSIDLLILTQASKRTFIFLSPIFNLNNIVHYSNRFAKKISSKSEGENQKLERKRNHRFKKPFFPPSNVINNPTILIFFSSSSLSPSSVSPRLIHRGRARYLPLGSQKPRSTTKEGRGGEKKKEDELPQRGMKRDALWEDGKNGCGCCACTDIDRAGHATGCLSGYSSGSSPRLETRLKIPDLEGERAPITCQQISIQIIFCDQWKVPNADWFFVSLIFINFCERI